MKNNFQLPKEKGVALVTASTNGIGKAVAKKLFQKGYSLIINGRNKKNVEHTIHEFQKKVQGIEPSQKVKGVVANLIEKNSCERLFDAIADLDAPLKTVFINTPTPATAHPEALDDDMWNYAYRGLIRFPDEILQRSAKELANNGGGSIVVNSSCSATIPIGSEFYLANTLRSTSVAQAKSYARRYISQGVRINVLLTGYVDTSLVRDLAKQIASQNQQSISALWSEWEQSIPIGRLASVDEIASIASFLLSDESSYIVGTALEVDGGISMLHQNF